jgi:hypothetical protein
MASLAVERIEGLKRFGLSLPTLIRFNVSTLQRFNHHQT